MALRCRNPPLRGTSGTGKSLSFVMRHRTRAALLFFVALPCHGSPAQSSAEIIAVFQTYVALNQDYLSSVKYGKGMSGKSYQQLNHEVADYSEGTLEEALEASVTSVCQNGKPDLIRSLLKLQQATTNSASESPATALGRMFVCQPDAFSETFAAMDRASQGQLYSLVEFGFDNAILDYPTKGTDVEVLKAKLLRLKPSK